MDIKPCAMALAFVITACGGAPPPPEHAVTLPAPTCNCPVVTPASLPAARPPELDALGQQRVELARKRTPIVQREYERGMKSASELIAAYRDVAVAARESGLRGEALRSALTEYRDALARMRDHVKTRVAAGAESEEALMHVEIELAEAEFWLVEAKARL
jgi:hypothetical protein